jgi:hypothetical protein
VTSNKEFLSANQVSLDCRNAAGDGILEWYTVCLSLCLVFFTRSSVLQNAIHE